MNREQLEKELKMIEERKACIESKLNDKGCFITDSISWTFKFDDGQEITLNEITNKDICYINNIEGKGIINIALENGTVNFDLVNRLKKGRMRCSAIDKYRTEDMLEDSNIREDYYENVEIEGINFKSGNEIGSFNIKMTIAI